MKKLRSIQVVLTVMCLAGVLFMYNTIRTNRELPSRPQLKTVEEGGGAEDDGYAQKFKFWSTDSTLANLAFFTNKATTPQQQSKSRAANGSVLLADGQITGEWINRGPYNMPGAWYNATIEVGTDTIYATSCGHYGSSMMIYRGTVTGNDFELVKGSGRLPNRISDINVFTKNGTKAIIYTSDNGPVMVSFDNGMSFSVSQGLPQSLLSTVVERSSGKVYTSDGVDLYVSDDMGATFTTFANLGTASPTTLYAPLFSAITGYGKVYIQHGRVTKVLSAGTIETKGTLPGTTVYQDKMAIRGDSSHLYMKCKDINWTDGTKKEVWWISNDEGTTWTQKYPTGHYYGSVCEMSSFAGFGVSITDPDIVIAGYAYPCVATNALGTVKENYSQWGAMQGGDPWDLAAQKINVTTLYHPDFQSTNFFLDANGNEFSLWCSDGGLFTSTEVYKGSNVLDQSLSGWTNITVDGGSSLTETYKFGMVSGNRNEVDFAVGTQDQGVQNSRPDAGLVDGMVRVTQSPYGDGEACASGSDGEYGWNIGGDHIKAPFPLYVGGNFNWSKGRSTTQYGIAVSNIWFDLKDFSTTLWVLNSEVNKVHCKWSTFTKTSSGFNNPGYVAAVTQSPENNSHIWALDNDTVYKSTNGGDSYEVAVGTPMLASNSESNAVYGYALDNETILFAGKSDNSITSILSTDGGRSFVEVPGLPNIKVRWMFGDKEAACVIASTDKGPYIYSVAQNKWYDAAGDVGNGAPYFDGQWGSYNASTNTFRFSTWGSGIWDFKLTSVSNVVGIQGVEKKSFTANSLTMTSIGASQIQLVSPSSQSARIQIISLGGRVISSQSITLKAGVQTLDLQNGSIAQGRYLVTLSSPTLGRVTQKVLIK